jgi:tRNA pseudouridine55 synthase
MILIINKPKDWTSADVVAYIKSRSGFKKVGHSGTLDPLATGVLVVLTNNDTKRQDKIMLTQKEYIGDISFGASSPTYDLEGDLLFSDNNINVDDLKNSLADVLKGFTGEYEQEVPPYSAVKVQGKKLYDIARKNNHTSDMILPRKLVNVEVIEILEIFDKKIKKNDEYLVFPTAKLRIVCSSGFYVRSLANDLGKALDTYALLTDLVRTKVGQYHIENAKEIKDLDFDKSHYYL